MATYVIGDVQGCFDALQALLSRIKYDVSQDRLWFVGDLVNRGPASLATLRFIKSLGDHARVVLGNHDLHLLAVHYGQKALYPDDTIQDIQSAPDREVLIEWLRRQKLMHYDISFDVAMVHAGVAPQWTRDQALALAGEVEQVLQGSEVAVFLQNMYGNDPDVWSDPLTGWMRLRVITNYFTRVRFCDAGGHLLFSKKTALSDCPEGGMPWFKVPNRKMAQQNIVFGHWSALQGKTGEATVHALDTGVVWGGPLTAMRLEDGMRFQTHSMP